jgi:ubiquinone/menaquinone biosynthesis C-methylase UbiE
VNGGDVQIMAASKLLANQLGNPNWIFSGIAAFVWNRRNSALNDTVLDLLFLQPTDRVLDIGFGGGYLLKRMSEGITDGLLAGVDISSAIVARAKKRFVKEIRSGKLILKCAPVEALPFPDDHFTKISSVNSIFYWQNVGHGLHEIKRVLIQGGKVVLCFTNKASLENRDFARYLQIFEVTEVDTLMKANGFQDTRISTFSDKHRQYICITANR